MSKPCRIAYLVHDLSDPAVGRRVAMFKAGGASVDLAGFTRGESPSGALVLDETRDADMPQRVKAVARQLARPLPIRRFVQRSDAIVARTLEMRVLAWVARLGQPRRIQLIYECLDIHRLMLGAGLLSKALRFIEGVLLSRTDLLIVSSPAFEREYFDRWHKNLPPVLLIENRVEALDGPLPIRPAARMEGPWRIGWFGMIRCRKSLEMLKRLVATMPGRIEVVIRGRPSSAVFPDFAAEVEQTQGIAFGGAYARSDLAAIYGQVDFVWTMDFYEEGLNSSWLLPNRLYEGAAFGRPALAQAQVETGRWLKSRGVGIVLSNPETQLATLFEQMTRARLRELVDDVSKLGSSDLVCGPKDCRMLVNRLCRRVSF